MEVINLAEEEKDKVKELKKKLDLWIASSLNEGEEDPMEYVKRNHDYRKWYRKFFTDRYWGQSR
jgi:radical SAM superfamily enzyme